MPETQTDQWKVEYARRDGSTSTAYLDIPKGIEVAEMMSFPGVDKNTDEPVNVRWTGEDWEATPEVELDYLAVSCDALPFCDATVSGDFKVRVADGKAARLGYVLAYATREGWHVENPADPLGTKTYCPRHKAA